MGDKLFKEVDLLDTLGLFREADNIQKAILAANNFMLTTKKQNPVQQISHKLDMINNQLSNQDSDDSGGGGGDTVVELDNQEVEFKQK